MPKGETDSVVTVVLLGQNTTDKCLVGNAMLGCECFQAGKNMYQKALGRIRNELLYVINTPEYFWRPNQDSETNAIEEMKPSYLGSRMFLLVLQDKQLSGVEMEMFIQLKERFGEEVTENITVVLMESREASGQTCNTTDESLKQILHECNERICVFSKHMRGTDLVGQLLLEKHDDRTDRLNLDTKKQEEKHEPEQSITDKCVNVQPSEGEGMITMVLLGINSDDKCLIGNSILQHDCFMSGRTICDRVVARVADQTVCIVNTPDLFVYKPRPDPIADNMEEMQPSYAGPRMFLMILQDKTLSHEQMEMFADLKEKFGKNLLENVVVVLIGSKENKSENGEVDEKLKMILDECKERIFVCRSDVKSTELVRHLMRKTKNMLDKSDSDQST